jgi:hypothetical protein
MDYNKSIPDIYSSIHSEKNQKNNDIITLEINLEPYENTNLYVILSNIFDNLQQKSSSIIFRFELYSKNVFLDIIQIWNNMIIIDYNQKINKILYNDNDHIVNVKIYLKLMINNKYCIYHILNPNQLNRLYTSYCGIKILFYIILQTYEPIKDNLIKLKNFNIEILYKVKQLYKDQNHYLLTLQYIKNIYTDDYIDFTLYDYHDLNKIIDIYNNFGDKLYKINNSNIKYITDNNIILPEDIRDEDGWNNTFYFFDKKTFIKKYNVIKFDLIELSY